MFSKIASSGRRRRILSPVTLAASVGAHLLILGGILVASNGEPRPVIVRDMPIDYFPPDVKPEPVPPPPVAPEPVEPQPHDRPPVPGDYVSPVPPDEIPAELPRYSPSDQPLTRDMVTGQGRRGDVIGTPPADDRPPAGSAGSGAGDLHALEVVEERPALRNGAEMQRVLQRLYPPLLRDAGITGQTQLRFVVDGEGRVEPGSVTVVSSTHGGFQDASLRAAEKFRFRPARIGGRGVRVVITMPITWTLDRN